MGTVVLSEPSDEQEEQIIYILNEVEQPSSITVTGTNGTPISVTATATQYLQGNLKDVSDTSSNENEILLEIKDIVVGATVVRTTGGGYNKPSGAISGQMLGAYIEYEATRIEVTVYGNTIGIDLVDKTVYIPETDKTSKKVHSIEGNELMQTTNTKGEIVVWTMRQNQDYGTEILGGTLPLNRTKITFYSQNAINSKKTIYAMGGIEFSVAAGVTSYTYKGIISVQKIVGELDGRVQVISDMYANTQRQYANGKETATIRCSIGDYFDKDGNKQISDSLTKNLLHRKYLFGKKMTQYGVTATVLPDGGIQLKGTNTQDDRIFFNLSKQYFGDKDVICYEGATSNTVSDYTISMFGEGLSNVAIGYNKHNTTTWLSIKAGVTVDAVVYPMLNKGGYILYEPTISPMSFQIGDQVIPRVYGVDGKDRPMSTYKNGSEKVFQVLGSKIFYDGAVWQELSLQEV
jgi:hypothetical protein